MDSYREHPSDFDLPFVSDDAARETVGPQAAGVAIGGDERRMHVRAYNYWVSLLGGRDYPSIEDLEPADVTDFAANSVLLDFTAGREDPATPYIGAAIREECGLGSDIRSIADIPSRSLLSRLTDHYLQIIANRAPIGFEAEFVNQRDVTICYRGILMPFSSDGDTIDFIYGVINWKESAQAGAQAATVPFAPAADEPEDGEIPDLSGLAPVDEPSEPATACAAEPGESIAEETEQRAEAPQAAADFCWQDDPLADPQSDELTAISLDEDAGLADRLWAARESAEAVKAADCRSRAALYRALSMAYDFALASLADREGYSELLEESGMKAQARAPMTPIVKLVFGIDYDKTRLTEFAAALCYAQRQEVGTGKFLGFIEKQAGGLKALVAAERQARRPEPRPDTAGEAARARLRQAEPLALETVPGETEFTLVLARRSAAGGVEPVAVVDDQAMIERAIRRAGL